jgi:hypothetical protein
MKTFAINDRYSIACEWKKTRLDGVIEILKQPAA